MKKSSLFGVALVLVVTCGVALVVRADSKDKNNAAGENDPAPNLDNLREKGL